MGVPYHGFNYLENIGFYNKLTLGVLYPHLTFCPQRAFLVTVQA